MKLKHATHKALARGFENPGTMISPATTAPGIGASSPAGDHAAATSAGEGIKADAR